MIFMDRLKSKYLQGWGWVLIRAVGESPRLAIVLKLEFEWEPSLLFGVIWEMKIPMSI